jgi:hypothetical protein
MASGAANVLKQSQDLFGEFLSALRTGYRVKEFLPAEALHLAERFLEGPPIGDGLLQPLILLAARQPPSAI